MASDSNMINLLQTCIKGEAARQKAIANNLANINTKGYRKYDVSFEDALAEAIGDDEQVDPEKVEFELYQPMTGDINEQGNDVNLHAEVGQMVKNTLRHKAYVRILKKTYEQYDLAMKL